MATEHRSVADIQTLISLGHSHFAEKYCQEMLRKWVVSPLKDSEVYLSFFGHLQANKVRKIMGVAHSIEGVGSLRIAAKIAAIQAETLRKNRLLLQVNISREAQKNGCLPEDAARLLHQMREDLGLDIEGVMIIPQRDVDPSPSFRWARRFADQHHLRHCAMGMSLDYSHAIDCGATIVRVGRLVWGERLPQPKRGADSPTLSTSGPSCFS